MRHRGGSATDALSALGIYLVVSVLFFGLPVLGRFSTRYIGDSGDGTQFMWFLNWWPYALTHGLNPFISRFVWAPIGANLTWATSIPGASLLLAPITLTLGPVVAYNVLMLIAPPSAAFCAFLLVRRLTGSWPSGLFGGYIFGFSTAMIGQELGHPHIALVFALPLLCYVLVCAFQARWPIWQTALVVALLLTVQFLTGIEYFAVFAVFAATGWLFALWLMATERQRLIRLGAALLGGYLLAGVAVSPFLHSMAVGPIPPQPIHDPAAWSTDLLNLLIPTPITLVGGSNFAALSAHFVGNSAENGAYLGVPLLAIVVLYAVTGRASRWRRVLLLLLAVIVLCALGPVLHVAGTATIPLPWALPQHLPLLQDAQPDRFMLFAWLLLAIAVGHWLATAGSNDRMEAVSPQPSSRTGTGRTAAGQQQRWPRLTLVAFALLLLLPTWNVQFRPYWSSLRPAVPSFFIGGAFRSYLHPGENIVIFPFSGGGATMADQALSGMAFTMSNGYVGSWQPPAFSAWPIVQQFQAGQFDIGPDGIHELQAYLGTYRVEAVVVTDPAPPQLATDLNQAGLQAGTTVGGVTLYGVPRQLWTTYQGATAESIQAELLSQQFDALYRAAGQALGQGVQRTELAPRLVEAQGLLPISYGSNPRSAPDWNWTKDNGWLGPYGSAVGVGVVGSWAEVAPIMLRYRAQASEVYFPYPDHLASEPAEGTRGELLMVFPTDIVRQGIIIPGTQSGP